MICTTRDGPKIPGQRVPSKITNDDQCLDSLPLKSLHDNFRLSLHNITTLAHIHSLHTSIATIAAHISRSHHNRGLCRAVDSNDTTKTSPKRGQRLDEKGTMGFGDFSDICAKAAIPLCSEIGPITHISGSHGMEADCYARNIELANTIIFQGAASCMHILALVMTVIMILHVRSKFTAVGRLSIIVRGHKHCF